MASSACIRGTLHAFVVTARPCIRKRCGKAMSSTSPVDRVLGLLSSMSFQHPVFEGLNFLCDFSMIPRPSRWNTTGRRRLRLRPSLRKLLYLSSHPTHIRVWHGMQGCRSVTAFNVSVILSTYLLQPSSVTSSSRAYPGLGIFDTVSICERLRRTDHRGIPNGL